MTDADREDLIELLVDAMLDVSSQKEWRIYWTVLVHEIKKRSREQVRAMEREKGLYE